MIGRTAASHAEYGGDGEHVITQLACSLELAPLPVILEPSSRLAKVYGCDRIDEMYNCSYGLDPGMSDLADSGGMRVSARDVDGTVRAVERPDHPFFVATLYQPQRSSSASAPHPLIGAFVLAVAARS